MADTPDFLSKVLKRGDGAATEEKAAFTSERQLTAQAFNLHVEKRNGVHAEGFAWSHYVRYKWTDEGTHERLAILLGGAGAVEIEGHNLGALVNEIRECKLNGIQEMISAQAALKQADDDDAPIISNVRMYPDFEDLLQDIKGEGKDAAQGGFTKRITR